LQPNGLDESVFSLEAFQWAMSMLLSRAIDLRETGELALVPYADLLNHSPYCSAYFFYNEVPFSKEREVVLYADRSYAKNDQVLISYGQKSNAELLLLYGFVVDRNLFDEVEVTISLDPTDPRYDEKAAFLQQQGLTPTMAFPLLIDRYSSELLQCARARHPLARSPPR
jgi:histone-lysine N-methyltransferase SETD3